MTKRLLLLAGMLVCLAVSPAGAQPAFLVKDIQTGTPPAKWDSGTELVELGGFAYFRGDDRIHGSELWRSDGTMAGTTLVRDICPGVCSSTPSELTVVGGKLFFRADEGVHGPSLWKSSGTADSTVLVRAVEPSRLAAFGSLIAFMASSPGQGPELWRSDGTAAGTLSLGDLRPGPDGSSPWPLGELSGLLLFNADDGTQGRELWQTDGTLEGTSLVEDINPGPDSGLPFTSEREGSAEMDGKLLFRAVEADRPQTRLWASDGTAAGTARVHDDVAPTSDLGSAAARFVKFADEVFFSGGGAVWRSNGTEAGTVAATGSLPNPSELTVVGARLYFKTASGFFPDTRLFVSDGTEAGTTQVPLPSGVTIADYGSSGFRALGSKLVFFASNSGEAGLWTSDGTGEGTVLLAGFQSALLPTTIAGGLYLFRAQTEDGWELWASDGTPAGTGSVKRLDQSDASGLRVEIEPEDVLGFPALPLKSDLAGTLLLSADSGVPGGELWRSDGTEAGTVLVKETGGQAATGLTPFGAKIFFSTGALWSSDGTAAGTVDHSGGFVQELTPFGEQLYFADNVFGSDFKKIGPSDPDSTLVTFLYPGFLQQITALGSRLYFLASGAPIFSFGLWTSDGTEAGTAQIPGVSSPDGLIAHRGALIFSAIDGTAGRELWLSDGTEAGSHRVKDILPGTGSSNPSQITSTSGLVFFVADDGTAGEELWRSDGTEAGTVLVSDIRPGVEPSWIQEITAVGDRVFFAADDGVHGVELWVSDGSAAGTHIVKDALPGSSYPRYLKVAGHLLYFAAVDNSHGLEPWKTDGTEAGTVLIQDVNPGQAPSTPTGFVISGPYLYFTANDGTHGFELHAVDRAADFHTLPPCRVFDTRNTSSLASSTSRTFTVAGACGVPAGAQAVAANLTAIGATGNGRVVVYPAGPDVPATSSLNFQAGVTRANNAVIGLTVGQVDALATVVGGGTVHLALDVTGYYQ